jgi:hypothetical protein
VTCSELAATWLTAVGTLAASGVALLIALRQEKWRRAKYHPSLEVTANILPPNSLKIPRKLIAVQTGQVIDEAPSYYLRVKIRNIGTEAARNVEVYARSLERLQDNVRMQIPEFPPMNLSWSNWAGITYLPLLAPDTERYCDIAHIIEPTKRAIFGEEEIPPFPLSSNEVALSFDLRVKPLTRGYIVGPGTYLCEIEVAAANAGALKKKLRIEVDGRWSDTENRMLGDLVRMRFDPD